MYKLKLVIKRFWKIECEDQKLWYMDSDMTVPNLLEDAYKELEFYGIEEGGVITVEETSKEEENKIQSELRQKQNAKMIQQEKEADDTIRWKKL